jgi:hypothetical protein
MHLVSLAKCNWSTHDCQIHNRIACFQYVWTQANAATDSLEQFPTLPVFLRWVIGYLQGYVQARSSALVEQW